MQKVVLHVSGTEWTQEVRVLDNLAATLEVENPPFQDEDIRFPYSSHTSRNLLSEHASDLATKLDQCPLSRKGSRLCFWAMLSSMEVLEVLWQTWVLIVRSLGSEVSCSDFQGHPWE